MPERSANVQVASLKDNAQRIGFLASALKAQLFAVQQQQQQQREEAAGKENAAPPTNIIMNTSIPVTSPDYVDGVVQSLKPKESEDFIAEMKAILKTAHAPPSGGDGGGGNTLTSSSAIVFPPPRGSGGGGGGGGPTAASFPFYSNNATYRTARAAFNAFNKSNEIQLRFNAISTWDETHAKVLELLTDDNTRDGISLAEYKEVMAEYEEWCTEQGFGGDTLPKQQSIRGKRALCQSALPAGAQPGLTLSLFYSCPAIPKNEDGSDDDEDDRNSPLKKQKNTDGAEGATSTDDDTLAMTIARVMPHKVETRVLFQKYVKSISIVKTEAELIMCDGDGDGKITLGELEGYMSEIIPTVATLQQLPDDMVPYYTCSSARRIFWLLDPTSRGSIRISSLVNHTVLDDWLEVQMTADEQTRNWFGATISMQLREKFELLDIYGMSALNLECMNRYKKGIPMVIDDGLPKDISPLSSLFLQRVFDTVSPPKGMLDYAGFIDFVVAIEFLPASCPRPLFFWRIFDIFGDGRITPLVAHSFFKETYAKLKSAEVEVAPIEIIIQEIFDLIPSKEPLVITKEEFVTAKQCGLFSALLVDCLAFYTYENREQK